MHKDVSFSQRKFEFYQKYCQSGHYQKKKYEKECLSEGHLTEESLIEEILTEETKALKGVAMH